MGKFWSLNFPQILSKVLGDLFAYNKWLLFLYFLKHLDKRLISTNFPNQRIFLGYVYIPYFPISFFYLPNTCFQPIRILIYKWLFHHPIYNKS